MVALAALAAIVVLAQTAVILLLMRSHRRELLKQEEKAVRILNDLLKYREEAEQRWAEERRELLNRIQAPNRIPVPVPEGWAVPEDEEPDESHLVGTIAPLADDYGEDE